MSRRLSAEYDEGDIANAERRGMLKGGIMTTVALTALWAGYSMVTFDEVSRSARVGRTVMRQIDDVRRKFRDTKLLFVDHDESNPSHLRYIDSDGRVVASVRIGQIDRQNAIIAVFNDQNGNKLIDQDNDDEEDEEPLFFSDAAGAITYIESLAK